MLPPVYVENSVGQMMDIVKFEAVEEQILTIRGMQVILDSDVAALYGV